MNKKRKKHYAISKKQRRTIIAAVGLLAVCTVWLDHRSTKGLRQAILNKTSLATDRGKYHLNTFTVTKVVDGDTLDIDIPDAKYSTTRIRLLGVDTPETKHPRYGRMYFGPEAADFVTAIALQKKVTVIIDDLSPTRDRYKRLLAYIELSDGNILNKEIIRNGFGYADLRFPHSDFQSYKDAMLQAIEQKTGLWKNVKKDQLPNWLRKESPHILD